MQSQINFTVQMYIEMLAVFIKGALSAKSKIFVTIKTIRYD